MTGQFVQGGSIGQGGSKGQFELTGGTGRFKNVSGCATFQGRWINYPITAVIEFSGWISYDASDR
jgi:hypothetical protein